MVVEEVLRKDEIVIKNLGEYLRNVKLFPGATIAPDGSLILLVDVNRLIMGESIERRPLDHRDERGPTVPAGRNRRGAR